MEWEKLFEDHNVSFTSRGPNTKRGEVSIQCPWCGDDDPSMHLGISLTTENWGCHRNAQHRGKSTTRLIAALLGCSFTHAKLVARQYSVPDPSSLDEAIALLEPTSETPEPNGGHSVEFLPEFEDITGYGFTTKFAVYLSDRGFTAPMTLSRMFDLKCALTGGWKNRIIIPVKQAGRLIGWTGRALEHRPFAPRYMSSSAMIKTVIFDQDRVMEGGELLYVVEGPFDAMKLTYWDAPIAKATCGFGTSWSVPQICLLNAAAKKYKKVCLLFDKDASGQAFQMRDWIRHKSVVIREPPTKDPAEMTVYQIRNMTDYLVGG